MGASQVAALANNLTQQRGAAGVDLITVFAGPQVGAGTSTHPRQNSIAPAVPSNSFHNLSMLLWLQVNLRKLALGQASQTDELLKAQTRSSSNSATMSYVTAEVWSPHRPSFSITAWQRSSLP